VQRQGVYFLLMATCIGLFVLAWTAVRYVSVPAAVAMSAVAAVIPPIAAVVGNSRRER
jgi:Protein of unknown function (DUF3099)